MTPPDGGRQRGHPVTERDHENPVDIKGVTDKERARMLLNYLDTFRAKFGVTPQLMPLNDEGKGPIATGRFRVVEESPIGKKIPTAAAMAATVEGFEAARRIAEEGALKPIPDGIDPAALSNLGSYSTRSRPHSITR